MWSHKLLDNCNIMCDDLAESTEKFTSIHRVIHQTVIINSRKQSNIKFALLLAYQYT